MFSLKITTMCWIGMFFEVGCEAANAGEILGPRAVVNAVTKASIFLGGADTLIRLNIFLLVPSVNSHRLRCTDRCRGIGTLTGPYFAPGTRLLKIYEFEITAFPKVLNHTPVGRSCQPVAFRSLRLPAPFRRRFRGGNGNRQKAP